MRYELRRNQTGEIFILAIVVVAAVLINTLMIVGGSSLFSQNAKRSQEVAQATHLAEAGVDKALASLNKTGGSYIGENETALGTGSYSVTITTKDAGTKIVEATGYIPNKTSPKTKKTIKIQISKGIGASFVYGVQVGEGGLELGNSNKVIGSVYSNGNIVGNNSNEITGDVWVAGGPQPNPDQESDCGRGSCADFLFGKNVAGDDRLDVAQSFKPTQSAILNKISLRIKKVGNPPDVTVRILKNDDGRPNKNEVLSSGTLYSSLVTPSYGWIDVTFTTSPRLNADTTYWLMVDTSASSRNYWSWQEDLTQSYTRGKAEWSPSWQSSRNSWVTINGDLDFRTYMGGSPTSIRGGNGFVVGGDVHANTIENLTIRGGAYYQVISSSTAGTYHPGSADPPPKVFPISDANIAQWQREAEEAGVRVGNIESCVSTLGPGKIVGNVVFNNSCIVTIKSPVWITGNFDLNNSNVLRLSAEYGGSSGVIVIDGITEFGNSNRVEGTGVGSSMLMITSTYDSRTSRTTAIEVNNSGNTAVLYANKGIIEPGNSNSFKELTGWGIRLMNSSVITYETGISSVLFSSGPSGSYSLVKGTYQLK